MAGTDDAETPKCPQRDGGSTSSPDSRTVTQGRLDRDPQTFRRKDAMNPHLSAALAQARAADLRREAHEHQRARVLASLVAVSAPPKPTHRRWAEVSSATRR
jgi:hypothetical protein